MTKQIVVDYESDLSVYDFKGPIDSVIKFLTQLRDDAASELEAKIEARPYGHDGGVEFVFVTYRYETDAEYGRRLEAEKKQRKKAKAARQKKEDRERAEYERLKAKFG